VRWAALAAAALLLTTGIAVAQQPDSAAIRIQWARPTMPPPGGARPQIPDFRLLVGGIDDELDADPAVSQRPIASLAPAQANDLRMIRSLRGAGQFDRAAAMLEPLERALPHHPLVITERARLLLTTKDFAGAERFARAERLGTNDSLVVGRELSFALESLGRRREAADVALACLLVRPSQAGWAYVTLEKLAAAEPKTARDAVKHAIEKHPDRPDLALLSARLDWTLGDPKTALKTLTAIDRPGVAGTAPIRWTFAEQVLRGGAPRDSNGAVAALVSLAGDARFEARFRQAAAERAWNLEVKRGAEAEGAPLLRAALRDIPIAQWSPEFAVALSRGLRAAGHADEARELLQAVSGSRGDSPALDFERALDALRDGPPARALPQLLVTSEASEEGAFRYAEALFYAGLVDSALARYQKLSLNPSNAFAGAALERIYLLEGTEPRAALPVFGRIAWEDWRGQPARAQALSDSLYTSLGRGPLWAQAAIRLSEYRARTGDVKLALVPLLAVADSLPEDRLAPLARQRAGDLYLTRLKDDRQALAQYEECLARYPRAWNAAEVRRKVEQLRRDRRF
jgi:tetratricopeptide (TPR) repeat protein